MKILGIIPARYASTRFPGKPLVSIKGKTMIQRVYEQAKQCTALNQVIVATDDSRIYSHVIDFGGLAIMTSTNHQSGTDRCAEVARSYPEYDIVINIQGDEPFINPNQIDELASCFETNADIATLVKKITTNEELFNPNTPKVLKNVLGEAIYFSRATIPLIRGVEKENWLSHYQYYKHIGIYGYRSSILHQITKLLPSTLEKAESLEQLRWIENGYRIKVAETEHETFAIDTPADLEKILQSF
jgi:3-deoxy-manno-octulosonate cytidylyltransferase (CMP-KDO synthetase)